MHFADTSFFLSMYGEDTNRKLARTSLAASNQPLRIHALNDFEFAK